MDFADITVLERRSCLGFADELIFCIGVSGKFRRKELQCNGAMKAGVFVDGTDASMAEVLEDFVAGKGIADHGNPTRACVIPTAQETNKTAGR